MYKFCVFAGTAEGRAVVEFLSAQPVSVTACVATEYGKMMLSPAENLNILTGRMSCEEMENLFADAGFHLVIDATHPYASAVTENIERACEAAGTEYLRLSREELEAPEDAVFVGSTADAVSFLNTAQGNILLATGSKELSAYTAVSNFSERVYARVLPAESSLRACRDAGLLPSHILAMQGPFSREMNAAMLRSVSAAYLVSKADGRAGGFREKADAAREAAAKLVVIGAPPQRSGLSLSEAIDLLCSRFRLQWRPQVTVAGIGPGKKSAMTGEVCDALRQADCIIGAGRMMQALEPEGKGVYRAVDPAAIAAYIQTHREYRRFVVAVSGDAGFFSGTKRLLPFLKGCDVRVLPGLSSLSCLCARLGTSYENVTTVSLHGREKGLLPALRRRRRVFVLTGGEDGMGKLCRTLVEAGMGGRRLSVGQRLSYPDERIVTGTARELSGQVFPDLCAALIDPPEEDPVVTPGLPDEMFRRDQTVPMTKSEVRAVCLSKLRLTESSVCWDVGAGTGSVTVEMALQSVNGQVYAIEKRAEAQRLLRQNIRSFHLENVEVISGEAPEACRGLPAPTHAFIGGSEGKIREIIELLLQKNPKVRIVATAVTLESAAELTACLQAFSAEQSETVALTVAKGRTAGRYHLMAGENPVYIFTLQNRGDAL